MRFSNGYIDCGGPSALKSVAPNGNALGPTNASSCDINSERSKVPCVTASRSPRARSAVAWSTTIGSGSGNDIPYLGCGGAFCALAAPTEQSVGAVTATTDEKAETNRRRTMADHPPIRGSLTSFYYGASKDRSQGPKDKARLSGRQVFGG